MGYIIRAVRNGDTSVYAPTATGKDNQVLRKVDLGELGTHYLRVANTTPCTNGETSETACGFVIEFADIISLKQMNTVRTNVGGYPATSLFSDLNSKYFYALPQEIRDSIIDTTVVSGHGATEAKHNFVSVNQKLYLLSYKEVFGVNKTIDTASNTTRQLDYYHLNSSASSSNISRVKLYKDSEELWWLRTAYEEDDYYFYCGDVDGDSFDCSTNLSYGVSPAFRIG